MSSVGGLLLVYIVGLLLLCPHLCRYVSIPVNRPALGGTVPISTAMSRRPAILTPCPAFINHPILGGTSRFQV